MTDAHCEQDPPHTIKFSCTKQVEQRHKCAGEFVYKSLRWNAYFNVALLQRVEQFVFVDSDVIIATYPRTGTTFTQEVFWQVLNIEHVQALCPAAQDNTATFGNIMERVRFLELDVHTLNPQNDRLPIDILDEQRHDNRKRLIKTHCPLSFLHSTLCRARPRIILVFRNPLDTCVSYFNFYRGMPGYDWQGEFDEYVTHFASGQTVYGSYFDWVRHWLEEARFTERTGAHSSQATPTPRNAWPIGRAKHIAQSRCGASLLLVRYEDLLKRPRENVTDIATFLDVRLTDSQVELIVRNTSFNTMKGDTRNNYTVESNGFQVFR